MPPHDKKKAKNLEIKIDGEKYELEDRDYTLRELLVLSGNDPETTYLIARHGHDEVDFRDLDAVVELTKNMHFVTGDRGPAPVA